MEKYVKEAIFFFLSGQNVKKETQGVFMDTEQERISTKNQIMILIVVKKLNSERHPRDLAIRKDLMALPKRVLL